MDLGITPKLEPLLEKVKAFIAEEVVPMEGPYRDEINTGDRWQFTARQTEIIETLKRKAREQGLWNFFLTEGEHSAGLTTVEYAYLAEAMGRSHLAPEVFNCAAPDTGNMEVLAKYGSEAQQEAWLKPLLAGEIRSAFAMTEPGVASSDATNISTRAELDGDEWVINGEKHWISGAGDPRCRIMIVMVKTDPEAPKHQQQSQILVPMDTPGVEILRPMQVFSMDDAPHGHMHLRFNNVRVPKDNIILGPGRGFEISQGRLGPGRIHHCMRALGAAERALELMCRRATSREAFGKPPGQARGERGYRRQRAHGHRTGASPDLEDRLDDGQRGCPGSARVDLDDQDRGAERDPEGHRRGDPDARRSRGLPGHAAGGDVHGAAHAAPRRRARRGAPHGGGAHEFRQYTAQDAVNATFRDG
jgi:acyl-CoA dehydrogenase